jgi:hypothetical protein
MNKTNNNAEEKEVFRITPVVGKYYATALYTRKIQIYPKERYFTTNQLEFIGRYIRTESYGHGDAGYGYCIFEKNGLEKALEMDYEGKRCFIEITV